MADETRCRATSAHTGTRCTLDLGATHGPDHAFDADETPAQPVRYGYADDEGNVVRVDTFTDATDAAGRLGMDVVAQIGDGPWQSLPAEMTEGAPHPLRHMVGDGGGT